MADVGAPSPGARPLTGWMSVLDRIEAAMQQSLALADEPPPPSVEAVQASRAPLEVLDRRLARWQDRLEQMQRDATEADEMLAAEARALERWTQGLAALRPRLALTLDEG